MKYHRSLQHAATLTGIGLHSGSQVQVRLLPRSENGIVFARVDLDSTPEIAASYLHIAGTHHATALEQNRASVSTPEHLMAALWGMGISRCRIELDGPEIPILDGSALPWCELIASAGILQSDEPRLQYGLARNVLVVGEQGAVLGLPYNRLRVSADVEYNLKYLAPQVYGCDVTPEIFERELAPARTFTLESWLAPLRAANLIQGGSTDNAIVFSPEEASSPLRFETELARHKTMDLLGDVALLFGEDGSYLQAHLIAVRAGHELHRQWMVEAINSRALNTL